MSKPTLSDIETAYRELGLHSRELDKVVQDLKRRKGQTSCMAENFEPFVIEENLKDRQ